MMRDDIHLHSIPAGCFNPPPDIVNLSFAGRHQYGVVCPSWPRPFPPCFGGGGTYSCSSLAIRAAGRTQHCMISSKCISVLYHDDESDDRPMYAHE